MKKSIVIIGVVLITFIGMQAKAQIKVPTSLKTPVDVSQLNIPTEEVSKEILKALDPGKSFTSPDKLTKLLGNNKSFVNKVTNVMSGLGSQEEKLKKVSGLQNERRDFIEKLLGKGKAADYYGLVKKQIEPLVQKFELAKMFL